MLILSWSVNKNGCHTEFANTSNISVRHRTDRMQISASPTKKLVVLQFMKLLTLGHIHYLGETGTSTATSKPENKQLKTSFICIIFYSSAAIYLFESSPFKSGACGRFPGLAPVEKWISHVAINWTWQRKIGNQFNYDLTNYNYFPTHHSRLFHETDNRTGSRR